ncbi:hypothetical protein CEXT_179321 [Caerostris extrusa]|uniref:Uncharacterized protein n=1 Tax=Caerostris extrusa TaxID=172846 RepID=A0AAV4N8I1_CAEEX|nr:hypothetical protein CEXT_179321 [Caerostris extrusa]
MGALNTQGDLSSCTHSSGGIRWLVSVIQVLVVSIVLLVVSIGQYPGGIHWLVSVGLSSSSHYPLFFKRIVKVS